MPALRRHHVYMSKLSLHHRVFRPIHQLRQRYLVMKMCLRARSTKLRQFLPKQRPHPDPVLEAIQAEFLVRRMCIVVRQRQSKQQ